MLVFKFYIYLSIVKLEMRRKWSDPKSQTQYSLASLIGGDKLLFTMTAICTEHMLLLHYKDQ